MRRRLWVAWVGILGTLTGPVWGNPVLDWDALALAAIRVDNSAPTLSSRNLAILHVAIYDAVNSIFRTHQPYRFWLDAPVDALPEAAVNGAGREVMLALYPPFRARTESLYEELLASLPAKVGTTNGLLLGMRAARLVLEARTGDGSATQVPYIPSEEPGRWRRTPPFFRPPLDPHWRYVTPFTLPSIEPFVPPPPPALESAEYAAAFNELKALGSKTSTVRTADQSQIAVFWSDFSYTAMPPGHWHEIAATIARGAGTSLNDTARLFALLSVAQADSAIVCWEAKYRYNTWRPVTAIHRADEDNNPATEADPNWDQFLISPPFPEYTSGHSTFSKASAEVLTAFYGIDAVSFTATSDSLPGVFRSYTSLAACADEIGMSRIYGGIHFSFANREGKLCGKKIGNYVTRNWLLPLDRLPLVRLESVRSNLVSLRIFGEAGVTHITETSADFQAWTPVSTNVIPAGGLASEVDAGAVPMAFRVRKAPLSR